MVAAGEQPAAETEEAAAEDQADTEARTGAEAEARRPLCPYRGR